MLGRDLALALRSLRRDWRSGELRIVSVALAIAVGALTAVGFFTDRVEQAIERQGAELLAADLVLLSSEPIVAEHASRAEQQGLGTARTLSFRSVVLRGEETRLVEVKAVSAAYPLRGRLRVAPQPFAADAVTALTPARGETWVNASLLQELGLQVGEPLRLGRARLRISQVLTYEPDRGGELFSIAPRLLMNIEDVPATGLVQPGSRVRYRLLVAGERAAVARFRGWLEQRLGLNERLQTLEEGRPELRAALERARQFLGLAALVSVLLAGVAIAMAARRHAERHIDAAAIMRCLGATQRSIVAIFTGEALVLALAASLVGCALGYTAHWALARILSGFVAGELPAASLRPLLLGVPLGMVVLAGFALPPLLALRNVPPVRVLRRDLAGGSTGAISSYAAAFLTMTALIAWQARDLKLFAWVAGGTIASLLTLAAAALALILLTRRLRTRVGVAWRFGLANISRRARTSAAQIVAFGVGIMVLLLLSIVRGDLLEGWRKTIPEDAPNHFLINIQLDQVAAVREFLAARGIISPTLHPMVRARLVAINDKAVAPEEYGDARTRRLAQREFNLSWAAELRSDNRVVAGRWWSAAEHGTPLISFEQGLAERLGIELGDRLTYNVAGRELSLRVANLRSVDWDTFNVNFFTILPPGVLESYPASYVTSFHVAADERPVLSALVRAFPNVTVVDVDALMSKVREIMARASAAVEYVFLFTTIAGLAVLYAAIQATQDERRYESAVLRVLGAGRRQLLRALTAEFVALGMLAGTVAGIAATVLGYVLATHVFHIYYRFDPWIWVVGWLGGALGIGVAGVLGTCRVLRQPPARTLREV